MSVGSLRKTTGKSDKMLAVTQDKMSALKK
jgi:hypothetical protein